MKKVNVRRVCLLLAVLLTAALSLTGCAKQNYAISAIHADGTYTVTAPDGAEYRYAYMTAASEAAKTFDVTTFGAKGDGVTDDTQAFADAFSALRSGDSLYIPEGKFLVNESLVLDLQNVRIYGEAKKSEVLFGRTQGANDTPADASLFRLGAQAAHVTVEDLILTYTGDYCAADASVGKSCGLYIDGSNVTARGLTVSGFSYAGIVAAGADGVPAAQIRIDGCLLEKNRTAGIVCGDVDELNVFANTFRANGDAADETVGWGFMTADGCAPRDVRILANHFNENFVGGVRMAAGDVVDISENTFVSNVICAVDARGDLADVKISSNQINSMNAKSSQTIYAVAVGGTGNFTVTNNMIKKFGAGSGKAIAFIVDVADGTLRITENTMQCAAVDAFIDGKADGTDINCSSNAFTATSGLNKVGVSLTGKSLTLVDNVFKVSAMNGCAVAFAGDADATVITAGNVAELPKKAAFADIDAKVVKTDGNFLNGSLIS